MRRAHAILAAALLTTGPALAADAVFGTWTLDPARSSPPAGMAADVCYVTTLEDVGNGKFRVTTMRVHGDGTTARQDAVFAFDGGDHPNGLGDGLTTAFTRIDDYRYAMVLKDHRKAIATVMRTISADGSAMTQIGDGAINGKPFHEALVFARKYSTCEAPKQQ